jgi:hypothetical protein
MCNTYCFSPATIVTRTLLKVTLYVHCLSYQCKSLHEIVIWRCDIPVVCRINQAKRCARISPYIVLLHDIRIHRMAWKNYRVSIKSFPDYKNLLQKTTWNTNIYFFQNVTQLNKFFFFANNLSNGKKKYDIFLPGHHSINLF